MNTSQKYFLHRFAVAALCLSLASCALFRIKEPGIGKAIDWSEIDGWESDQLSESWPAFKNSCRALSVKPGWQKICDDAASVDSVNDDVARAFFERWFVPHELLGQRGKRTGLITGYYEPLLYGSFSRDQRYRYPLYARPENLLTIDLGELYPELENRRVRGRLEGHRVLPYYSRAEIQVDGTLLQGDELVWVDNRDDAFFLHIQGSGRVQLADGRIVGVGYADQNGHPYVPIGRILLQRNELKREEISLFTIRSWLREHPAEAEELLFTNPSYVFFVLRDNPGQGAVGSLNVPLTAERSIAIDPSFIQPGLPVWLSTNLPNRPDVPYRRLVMAQDTGGAIKGSLRADLFWGHGASAEQSAGTMKEKGTMVVLLPKSISISQ